MKKVMLKTTLSLAVALASTQIFASGFALNEQSISGMGTGFAGRSSSAEDASTVFGNPAGMSRIKRQEVTGGLAAIDASSDIKDAHGAHPGTNKGDMVPFTAVPMGYYVKPIDDHWAFGLGVYAPFGLITNYESGFQGGGFGSKSEVKVVTFQPTVSYAFNDRVSIGFGPTINRIGGTLESDVPLFGDTHVKIKGDDTALGYNFGVLVQATDTTRLGLTYHSKVNYKLEGHTDITAGANAPSAFLQSNRYDASLKIETPESVDFSVTQQLTDAWTLYAGSTWTRWSRLKNITVNNEGVTAAQGGVLSPALFGTITEEQNWHNTWAYAIGTSYKLNKQWVLRTGLTFDQSPTNNTDRSPRIPTGDRTIFSLGAGYNVTDDLTIDVAYSYLKEEAVTVNHSNAVDSYSAKYENSSNGFGVGATYRF
ncbi:long-chain fatty acid transporter FadL [Pseudomonas sp. FW306-02-F02-AA]|uniref:Long-chain fatty acid transport protein n=1 Tax=Pseudomonas fluorescens TaxID=294 RepID=A0A0N9WQ22_PSEFL|nr:MULTISPECIES: outer membrane protein transport protein [Pseudomonas]ALH99980.1 Long-chain fatty acid transport protein [Pseudomonas fluorescens]PMZ01132.1 long-chain fatty acid transporter FadL [Pseudomonas sp. FW306-02-F02-AB]PMZ07030.1 long-chain fatty acid transporter FadL [Pseudomonas sp. FW306-02-H06C]PMZ12692.1 long-chain fatty acid transporter FadL [Pseudomonas sp. FW306-02-F02-AA]PMZ18803.1 long-chain fatty acid transporter FadL [Pseudomonas sp. FW306-02-F08-AA]